MFLIINTFLFIEFLADKKKTADAPPNTEGTNATTTTTTTTTGETTTATTTATVETSVTQSKPALTAVIAALRAAKAEKEAKEKVNMKIVGHVLYIIIIGRHDIHIWGWYHI